MINRDRLAALRKIEDERFLALHPKSGEMFKAGQKNMPGGVPMSWMAKWPGAYPVFVQEAKGARNSIEQAIYAQVLNDFIQKIKIDIFQKRKFVFTPKGDVLDMPEGATPVDFAYAVHTEIGNHATGALVNNTMASLDQELKNGDMVEILIEKKRKGPNKRTMAKCKSCGNYIPSSVDICNKCFQSHGDGLQIVGNVPVLNSIVSCQWLNDNHSNENLIILDASAKNNKSGLISVAFSRIKLISVSV